MGIPIDGTTKRLDTILYRTEDERLTLATNEAFYVTGSGGYHIPTEETRLRDVLTKEQDGDSLASLFDDSPSINYNAPTNFIDAIYEGTVDGVQVRAHVDVQSTSARRTGEDEAHGRRYDSLRIDFEFEGTVPEGFERTLTRTTRALFDDMYVHTGIPRLETDVRAAQASVAERAVGERIDYVNSC